MELLKAEKESLGFYVSSHPLKRHKELIELYSNTPTGNLPELSDGKEILIGGVIGNVKITTTKKGDPIAYFTVEDMEGVVKCVLFKNDVEKLNGLLHAGEVAFIKGRLSLRDAEPSIRVADVIMPGDISKKIENKLSKDFVIKLGYSQITDDILFRLKELILANKGTCPVFIELTMPGGELVKIKLSEKYFVSLTENVYNELNNLIGDGCITP